MEGGPLQDCEPIPRHVGFMQGRLSPPVDGRIQAFPWDAWQQEFSAAQDSGLELMEWTLDQDRFYENPLLTPHGRSRIRELALEHRVRVESVTCDFAMEVPVHKVSKPEAAKQERQFRDLLVGCQEIGIRTIVIPLVDAGAVSSANERHRLVSHYGRLTPALEEAGVCVAFESDLPPHGLRDFMAEFPNEVFFVNYDVGNSASLGFDPAEELSAYGSRVGNVHLKDRVLSGATVAFGLGNADFPAVFAALHHCEFSGNYIVQGARATDGRDAETVTSYIRYCMQKGLQ